MAETYKIAIVIEGRDRASRPLTNAGNALGKIGQIAGGILAARVFERLAAGIGGMVRSALQAVTDYERLGLALRALSARELLAMNHGQRFTAWMKDNLQATDYQINRYTALRAEYERIGKALAEMVAKGQGQTDYYWHLEKYQATLKKQIEATIPGFDRLSTAMKKAALGGLDMATALRNSIEPSRELLKWSIQLAIHSPFSTKGVVNAMKTAMAYGFTIDQAKRLTQTMIDFSAATGASGDVMDRIALALGQVRAKGRLMGQEILQLVNAGVPVNDILQDMGYNLQDIKKKGVPAQAFIEGFTKYMQENFGGAAARQTSTWAGLLNTLGDLKELGLKNFFEGAFKALQPLVGKFAEWMQVAGLEKLRKIGERIGALTKVVIDLASADWDSVMLGFRRVFGMSLGKAARFTGFLRDAAQKAERLAGKISKLKNAVAGFVRGPLAEFISANKDDLMAALKAVGAVLAGSAGLGLIAALGTALLSLLTPINLLAAVVAFLVVAWRRDWGGIREIVGGATEWLQSTFEQISEFVQPIIDTVRETVAPAFEMLQEQIARAGEVLQGSKIADWGAIFKKLGKIIGTVAKIMGGTFVAMVVAAIGVFAALVRAVATAIAKALPGMVAFANGVGLIIEGILDVVIGFANTIVDAVKALLGKGSWEPVLADLHQLWEGIKEIFWGIVEAVIGALRGMIGLVYGLISGFVDGIIDFFRGLWDKLVGHSIIPDMLSDIVDAFTGWVSRTLGVIAGWIADVLGYFAGLASDMLSKGAEVMSNLWSGVSTVWARFSGWISEKANSIAGFFGGIVSGMYNVGHDILSGLWSGMKSIWDGIKNWLAGIAQDAIDTFRSITRTRSPSLKFAEIGRDWMRGLAQGIGGNLFLPVAAAGRVVAGVEHVTMQTTWHVHYNAYGAGGAGEDDVVRAVNMAAFLAGGAL